MLALPGWPRARSDYLVGDARRCTAVTCTALAGSAMSLALGTVAMACSHVSPPTFICSMTDSKLAANRLAFGLLEAMPCRCACLSLGTKSSTALPLTSMPRALCHAHLAMRFPRRRYVRTGSAGEVPAASGPP